MPILETDSGLAVVRLVLAAQELPGLLAAHTDLYPGARILEESGAALLRSNFSPDEATKYVKRVCQWGGGHRFVDRVMGRNTPDGIAERLQAGLALTRDGDVAGGVAEIAKLQFLGQSFASKQLRFMAPDRAVILDSVIRSRLGYGATKAGYGEFLGDCEAILLHAQQSHDLDAQFRQRLRVCDIESAIFAKLQGS